MSKFKVGDRVVGLAEPVFLDKFEEGKKYVFDKATYETWSIQSHAKVHGNGWQNLIDGLIVDVNDEHDGDVGLYSVAPEWCKEVKGEKETPKYYNGRVIFVNESEPGYTKGKIYEFVNGYLRDDDGDLRPKASKPIKNLDEYNLYKDFIEVIE